MPDEVGMALEVQRLTRAARYDRTPARTGQGNGGRTRSCL
jgi:hypothetical protein